MRKKLLALLLALGMVASLCACGNDGSSGAAPAYDENPAASDNNQIIDAPYETSEPSNAPNADGSSRDNESPATDEDHSDNPDNTQIPNPATGEAVKLEGLILMTVTNVNFCDPKIYYVDIETGDSKLIAEWDFRPRQGEAITYSLGAGFRCGRQECFADGYSKVAVSQTDSQSGQTCAGWLEADGNFFNVTEALGQLSRSDFDDAVQYYAVGFMDDEFFVYRQISGAGGYHYVPLDNLDTSAIQDGLPFPGCENGEFPEAKITDYVGDSRFLINAGGKFAGNDGISRILDMATGEKTDYVPGTSRLSWHAVLSPDGSQVAFMSRPKNGTEVDIYIMPLTGGDPVKVPTEGFELSGQQRCENGPNIDGQCTMLVEWR